MGCMNPDRQMAAPSCPSRVHRKTAGVYANVSGYQKIGNRVPEKPKLSGGMLTLVRAGRYRTNTGAGRR